MLQISPFVDGLVLQDFAVRTIAGTLVNALPQVLLIIYPSRSNMHIIQAVGGPLTLVQAL